MICKKVNGAVTYAVVARNQWSSVRLESGSEMVPEVGLEPTWEVNPARF